MNVTRKGCDESHRGAVRSFLRDPGRSKKISTMRRVREGGRNDHNNTPQQRERGQPDAGTQPFED